MRLVAALLLLAAPLASCATTQAAHPEAALYNPSSDARAALATARDLSAASGKPVIAVLGANWCHDSRALAGWLETPRFKQLFADSFELVFVDVGNPQTGEGRNLEIARDFGIVDLVSTPALLVIAPDGTLLNRDSATSWRNAASRSGDAIYAALARYAPRSHSG